MKSINYPMHSKDVYLRAIDRTDIEQNTIWINSEYISDIMGYLPVMPFSQQIDWFEKLKNDKSRLIFAICLKESKKYIGNTGLGKIDFINRHTMFSIFIADQTYHNKGIGSTVTRLMLDFAFKRLNLNKVYLQTSERFVSAVKMYEKFGFQKDGVLRQHYYSRGKFEDKIIYSILKEEYNEKRN